MIIVIRADGGLKIGMGHIMRTLVLAKELAKTDDVFYICRVDKPLTNKYKIGIEKVKTEGFNVKCIDENNIIDELKNIKADLLITDSYDVDEKYFNETKKIFIKTGYIDDLNKGYFNVDFIVNQNINAEEYKYKTNEHTKLFLGPKYALLREEFRNPKEKNINEKVKSVLITVGGSDYYHITEKILKYVYDLEYNFHVVVGPAFDNIEELRKLEEINENIQLHFNANMCELMQKCDIAISSCGSTLYELSACRVPTLGIIVADNQQCFAEKMHYKGLINNLGWFNDLNEEKFIKNLKLLISNLDYRLGMVNSQKVVNKNGVKELAKEIYCVI
jgi:UDP-2,4-diacetamido-2,4,6-trideoxy-beta-L-altropyranose hydrolase